MLTDEDIRKFLGDEPPVVRKIRFPKFEEQPKLTSSKHNYDFLKDVNMEIEAELGRTSIKVKELLSWSPGHVISLDKLSGEIIDLNINDQPLAKGEIIIINDTFGVRITVLNNQENLGKKGKG